MIEDIMIVENMFEGITLPKGYEIDVPSEKIIPPKETYFLRGIKNWNPGEDLSINQPEISVSLQKDGLTLPLYPYGYIVNVDKGGIIRGYDRDITSEVGEKDIKIPSNRAAISNLKVYREDELDDLVSRTTKGAHNEIIVRGNKIDPTKAYIVEGSVGFPGLKKFKKNCRERGIEIHIIPKSIKPTEVIQHKTPRTYLPE